MTLKNRTDCRILRSAILRFSCTLLAAAVLYVQPQPSLAGGEWYGLPDPIVVTATQAEIDQLDAETQAVVDALKSGSPVAVEYAERASGVLIFPKVETSAFILGGTRAMGVLYKKDGDGAYQKAGYYRVERASVGLQAGTEVSSRVFMFMNSDKLQQFEAGSFVKFNADASFMTVDPETGVVDGDANADIAEFILNAKGSIGILKLQNLHIDPVKIVQ